MGAAESTLDLEEVTKNVDGMSLRKLNAALREVRNREEEIHAELGEDGVEHFRAGCRSKDFPFRDDFTPFERELINIESAIRDLEKAKAYKENLNAILLRPGSFRGILDPKFKREATFSYYREPVLNKKFSAFLKGLEDVRRAWGREQISSEEAFSQAQVLESEAGFQGVVFMNMHGDGYTVADILIEAIEKEVRGLGFRPSVPSFPDAGDHRHARSELENQIISFVSGVHDKLFLKPISPRVVEFSNVVERAAIGAAKTIAEAPEQVKALAEALALNGVFVGAVLDTLHERDDILDQEHVVLSEESPVVAGAE